MDLTPFVCNQRQCFPVIGGVLVYKDTTHLTGLYAQTLGPYLLRAVDSLNVAPSASIRSGRTGTVRAAFT